MPEHALKFDADDLDRLFLDKNRQVERGSHNLRSWQTQTGDDATAPLAKMITLHESRHHDLNNATVYGAILQFFSYLSQEASPIKQVFKQRLQFLVEQCRSAHEVYATGLGIMLGMDDICDKRPENLLQENPTYFQFYYTAEKLVQELNHIYFRVQAFTVVLRLCFQSTLIAKTMKERGIRL